MRIANRLIAALFIGLKRHHMDMYNNADSKMISSHKYDPHMFSQCDKRLLFYMQENSIVTTAVKQVFIYLLFFVSTGRSCRHEKSPSNVNEVISPEVLKIRAALFCIFTYLDMKTLLRAAEVCRDWKFVARHPAVWTRVLLENARISSKVLTPLTQTLL